MLKKALFTAATTMALGLFVGIVPAQAQDADAKIAELQKKVAAIEAKQSVEFHGYLRTRAYVGEAMKNTFTVEEFSFSPRMAVAPNVDAAVNLLIYPDSGSNQAASSFYVAEANMTVKSLPLNGKLIVGKDRNWAYGITPSGPNRLLSNYSLYSDTFTHDRVTGLQYLAKLGEKQSVDLNVAVINGYVLAIVPRTVGLAGRPAATAGTIAANTTNVLANRDGNQNYDNNLAVSARVGGNIVPDFNVGLSGYYGKLSSTEKATLEAAGCFGAGSVVSSRRTELGLDLRYKYNNLLIQAEATTAKLGKITQSGAQTQIAYNFDAKNTLIGQYGYAQTNAVSNANTITWDKSQVAVSFKHKLNKRSSLQLEHEWNAEDTPLATADKDNDVTFLEYFISY